MRGCPHPSSTASASTSPSQVRWPAVVVVAGVATLLFLIGAGSFACGTSPVGVEACQKIEKVRCESAQACGIDLGNPTPTGDTAKQQVASCIRYYDDQCLHGLVVTADPGPQVVDACVNAIINGDCNVVKQPETHPACQFLIPPKAETAPADAATDG